MMIWMQIYLSLLSRTSKTLSELLATSDNAKEPYKEFCPEMHTRYPDDIPKVHAVLCAFGNGDHRCLTVFARVTKFSVCVVHKDNWDLYYPDGRVTHGLPRKKDPRVIVCARVDSGEWVMCSPVLQSTSAESEVQLLAVFRSLTYVRPWTSSSMLFRRALNKSCIFPVCGMQFMAKVW